MPLITTKPIRYDVEYLTVEWQKLLKSWFLSTQSETIRRTLGKDWYQQILAQEANLANRLQKNFSLVVVGDFKRGKSTLINALLGQEVVTSNVTPETVTINKINYGKQLRLEACLNNGGKVDLAIEDISYDKLLPLMEELPQTIDHLSIEVPVEWLQGLSLVDTPGTGDIFKRFDSQVQDYLIKADAVIFVISALSPLSESEQSFLKLSVLPQDFPKIFFVVNMMDMAQTDGDADRLLTSIEEKIINLFPHARVFGVSALDELSRLQLQPRPNPARVTQLEQSFAMFREALTESIGLNRDVIQLSRVVNQFELMLTRFQSNLVLLRQAMQSDQVSLGKAIALYRQDSSELKNQIQQHQRKMREDMEILLSQALVWMDEFMDRMETEAITSLKQFSLSQIRRHYHFFVNDSVREAITKCLDAHRDQMIKIMETTAKAIANDFHQQTQILLSTSEIANNTWAQHQWNNLDTIQLLINFTPLQFLGNIVLTEAKMSKQSQDIIQYQQQLLGTLPELRQSLRYQIEKLYSSIADKMEVEIETSYKQDLEESVTTLNQAMDLASESKQKLTATNQGLQEASILISDTLTSLKQFKQKMWSSV